MYKEHMKSHPEVELASTAGNKPSPDPQSTYTEDPLSVSGEKAQNNKSEDLVVNNMTETHDSSVLNTSVTSSTTGKNRGMLGSASPEEGRNVSTGDSGVTGLGYPACSLPQDPVHTSDEGVSLRTDNLLSDTNNTVQKKTCSYSNSGINTRLLFPDAVSFPTSKPAVRSDMFPTQSETFRNETSVLETKSIPIHSDRANSPDKFLDRTTSIPYNSDVDYHGDSKTASSGSHNDIEGGDNKASLQVCVYLKTFCFLFLIV